MNSVQLIRLLDVLPVTAVRNAPGVSPRSLLLSGRDFRNVEKVLINGSESPTFFVMSETQLLAEVPELYRNENITAVSVLCSSLTFSGKSQVSLTAGTRIRKVRGILRLLQTFIRILLRTPGSNIFVPRSGGGLLSRVGDNITNYSAADAVVSVDSTRTYIVGVQTSNPSIPPSERLLSAEVINVELNRQEGSLHVTVSLTNHAGETAAATLST
jgi:hypothetical protein